MATHDVDPHLLVVLGATSDLMRRKLLPAIYRLRAAGEVPGPHIILGASRQAGLTDDGFRALTAEALAAEGVGRDAAGFWCGSCLFFQSLGAGSPEDFEVLAARIQSLEQEHHLPGNRVFYLALPPTAYMAAINGLGQAGLNSTPCWTRLVVEKPFGRDLDSATALNEQIHRHFDESQIYRIDHYLGKETVRNLLIFRFANAIFEPLWHRNLVKSVQIIPLEVTMRNITAGGMAKLLGIEEGIVLKTPVFEYHYKDDSLHDPLINDDHVLALDMATEGELKVIRELSFKINDTLKEFFSSCNIDLVDFKLEFGRYPAQGSGKQQVILADEISPDTCRFWEKGTGKKLDKDRFRRDLGGVEDAYQEMLKRVTASVK